MKPIALVGLSILALSLAATTSVKAETRTETLGMSTAPLVTNPTVNTKITPFALVSLAYQGEYRTQGIPGFASFQSGVSNQTITAKDLIKVAIAANQLSPDTQIDRSYINAVNLQLLAHKN
jgi:hypothetical protein